MFITILAFLLLSNGYNTPNDIYDYSYIDKNQLVNMLSTKESLCLSKTLYFETRGESIEGINKVSSVIINRTYNDKFPNTICEVINQKNQFTYDHSKPILNKKVYDRMKYYALLNINKRDTIRDNNILYYHTNNINLKWDNNLKIVYKIGNHIFYREY